ncbi:DUF7344 domain-containing protein [Halorussus litoreus]|uniref:DUF7344 domain-containing protein n=1 Tax=Halorussus litoreus TaxID=1710536 RepID=UPI000E27AD57|nr:ArsR family transcriptional regulator [Halorussus litoreus]
MQTNARTRLDEQFEALAHVERRRLLVALFRGGPDGTVPSERVVLEVESWAGDREAASLVALRHRHLPKLEDLGFIEWNQQDRLVTEGPQFGEVEPMLALLDGNRDELPPDWL